MATAALDYTFNLSKEHVRELPDGSLMVSGYASNYDLDRHGDTVTRAALAAALDGYMRNPALLYNHSYAQPAGAVTRARVDDRGLWIEARVARPAPGASAEVRGYFDMVRQGFMRAFSIGGKWTRDAARRLTSIDLREISIAAVGVNAGTVMAPMSAQLGKAFGDPVDPWADRLALAELRGTVAEIQAMRREVGRARVEAFLRS